MEYPKAPSSGIGWTPEEAHWLEAARRHIAQLAQQRQDARYVFHNDQLALYLDRTVGELAAAEEPPAPPNLPVHLAALFYPMGFSHPADEPAAESQSLARRFLLRAGLPAETVEQVNRIISETHRRQPQTEGSSFLADALTGLQCPTADEPDWPSLNRLERELTDGAPDRLAQARHELQALLQLRFHTQAGRRRWQRALAQRLLEQRRKVDKAHRNRNNGAPSTGNLPTLESGPAARGAQTYFRAVFRNHINLSAIADNKANIMISVNSVLIGVLITFLSYRNIAETQPLVLLPVIIFMVSGLASLVFAVLSARPKVTKLNTRPGREGDHRRNLAFFGNFITLRLDEFEAAMEEVLHDSDLLYGNLVRDLYHLGKVLDKKYRYLTISYNIFMVGLVITVALFLITFFNPTLGR